MKIRRANEIKLPMVYVEYFAYIWPCYRIIVTKTWNDTQRPTTIDNDPQRSHNDPQRPTTTHYDPITTHYDPTTTHNDPQRPKILITYTVH